MSLPTYIVGTAQTRAYALLRENAYSVLNQYELTPTLWSMIGIIVEARDGVRQSEIARAMNVKPPLITIMVRDLEGKGILQSVKNQFDSRAKLISVTPKGKKMVKAVEIALSKNLGQLLIGLTEDELLTYHKVLTTIITNGNRIKRTGV